MFSSSSCLRRLTSADCLPPNLALQLYSVLLEIPCLRQSLASVEPVSDSLSMATICSSVNLLFFHQTFS
jgi:hypothetical protein